MVIDGRLQPGSTSGCIMTGMPVGREGKVAVWGYALARDWLVEGQGLIWRAAAPDEVTISGLATFAAKELKVKNVAIMHLDTFYGETSRNIFTKWFTKSGGKVEKGFYVDRRHKETRKVRWTRLDEDLVYGANDLDRSVVVKSQIRSWSSSIRVS